MASRISPETQAQIVILRSAGYTLPLISKETGASTSTIKRILKRHPPVENEKQLDLVGEARTALREQFGSDDSVRALYSTLLADSLHHIEVSREVADAALGKLQASDTKDAALVFRALTAHSTALKGHIDVVKALAPLPDFIDDLPVLHVMSLTNEEVAEMRREQEEEAGQWEATE